MISLSLNPTYLCNFRCEFCYLTKAQLSDRNKLCLKKLNSRLEEIHNHSVQIDHVDLYGGEIALLSEEYLEQIDKVLHKYNKPQINVITNLSIVHPYFLKDHIDLCVSYDFNQRQDHEKVLQNMISLNKDISVLILASPGIMNQDVDTMIRTLNTIKNIISVEIKPYSTNQANELEASFLDYENFIMQWLNSSQKKNFQFINQENIQAVLTQDRNAFSDDHLYITPTGNFAVLEFDKNDNEYFYEVETFKAYMEWSQKEKQKVSHNSYCSQCEFKGRCLTEHYREVKDLKKSCNGFYNLIKWAQEEADNH